MNLALNLSLLPEGQEVGALAAVSPLSAVERPQSGHLISVSSRMFGRELSHHFCAMKKRNTNYSIIELYFFN